MKPRYYLRKNKKKIKIKIIAFTLFVLLIYLLVCLNLRIAEVVKISAEGDVKGFANTAVNRMMSEYFYDSGIEYSDVVNIVYGENGIVSSVQLDSIALSKIKSDVSAKIQKYSDENRNSTFNIPIGTLSKVVILNGLGPSIKIKAEKSIWVEAEVMSTFIDSGINQTLHRLYLSVTVHVNYVMPLMRYGAEYKVSYPFAETIIVGKVPDAYTNVVSDENTAGIISDYGADLN